MERRRASSEITERLVGSKDITSFLQAIFVKDALLSFSEFARRAGFSARSFPRDVMLGRRQLTPRSLPKFQKGLGLTGDAATYFKLLAMLGNPELNHEGWSSDLIRVKLDKLKRGLKRRLKPNQAHPDTEIYRVTQWPYLYALMEAKPPGLEVEHFADATGLSREECLQILGSMERAKIVRREGEGYLAENGHLIFSERTRRGAFQGFYLHTLRALQARARTQFDSDEHLFLGSVFSIPRQRMPELKQALHKVILDFIAKEEEPSPEHFCTLVCGLFPRAVS